ncbi:MAG TPA: phosphate transport system regulatory protein PhoU [Desulfobulbaceae bacterium]|nr:phosphate transport system regulatory protein PhoU [Desulfobulbaceae bacterium]
MSKHFTFHREVDQLKKRFLEMGAMVEDRVRKACSLIESRDMVLAAEIIKTDWQVNEMENAIEEECLKILALHQPVARDLRLLIVIIKIINELERIADIAVNMAKRVQVVNKDSTLCLKIDFSKMSTTVLSMLKMCLDSLVSENADLARQVFIDDDEVDEQRNQIYKTVVHQMNTDPGHASCLLNLYLLSRHLERIGDRATNIAEEIIYLVEGEIVRGEMN